MLLSRGVTIAMLPGASLLAIRTSITRGMALSSGAGWDRHKLHKGSPSTSTRFTFSILANHLLDHRFDAFWPTNVQPDWPLLLLADQPEPEKWAALSLA